MKPRFTLKFMLKVSLACVLLTLVWLLLDSIRSVRIDCFREFELIAAWIILLIGWTVYLLDLFRGKKK